MSALSSVRLWLATLGCLAIGVVATPANAAPVGPPQTTPAAGTPQLALDTGKTQQIRQLVQCGTTMFAVGNFTSIVQGNTTYPRNNAFAFRAAAPYAVTSWNPDVNGVVNTIAFNSHHCATAYLGGKFTKIGRTSVKDIAAVSTRNGAVATGFRHHASGKVETIVAAKGHLLAGGYFNSINGSSAHPYYASLNPKTGKNDGYFSLPITGHYSFTDQAGRPATANATRVYNQQVGPNAAHVLIEGDFTRIAGKSRQQAAMLDLGKTKVHLNGWHAPAFTQHCDAAEAFYVRGGAWAPDGSAVYFATTGYKPASGAGYDPSGPRAGLCDAAVAFPSVALAVSPKWVNYTGCDSLYAAAADTSTVYFTGHERWADNPDGCDQAGAGAIAAPGIVGLSPSTGDITYNPTRARGLGADDLVVTSTGLWVASDTYGGEPDDCAGQPGHAGICLLPY